MVAEAGNVHARRVARLQDSRAGGDVHLGGHTELGGGERASGGARAATGEGRRVKGVEQGRKGWRGSEKDALSLRVGPPRTSRPSTVHATPSATGCGCAAEADA